MYDDSFPLGGSPNEIACILWDFAEVLLSRGVVEEGQRTQRTLKELAEWLNEQGQMRIRFLKYIGRPDLAERLTEMLDLSKRQSAEVQALKEELAEVKPRVRHLTGELAASQGDAARWKHRAVTAEKERDEALARLNSVEDELGEFRALARSQDKALAGAHDTEDTLRRELDELRAENAALRRRQAEMSLTQPTAPSTATLTTTASRAADESHVAPEPGWMAEWRVSKGFDSDVRLIEAMGLYGMCQRAEIEATLVYELRILTAGSGTLQRMLKRMVERGLVGKVEPRGEMPGRAQVLYRLTDHGRLAFQTLFGKEAVESEYDRLLARHKSAEHVLLNLRARDVLLEHGAEEVDLYPDIVKLPGSRQFHPDLVAWFFWDEPKYVECERGGPKQLDKRVRKWNNYAAVSSDFYIVVPKNSAQNQLVKELEFWAFRHGPENGIMLHICNLSQVKKARELWTYEAHLSGERL